MTTPSRRDFLRRAGAGAALAGSVGSFSHKALAAPSSDEPTVPLDPGIEPLVRLLETTPREKIVETFAARVHEGVRYEDMLAALLLAAVRNVEPRPSVGFKFHSVLVVQSIHLASTALPEAERWLPVFWALDYFKGTQAADQRERGWAMAAVDESALPKASMAAAAFTDAMERWDEATADGAIAALVRTAKPEEIWPLFFLYGGRDYRSIGHKAIDVANSHRVLGVIGWKHAEPVLRSLAYALLMHEDGNPADRNDPADRPWRRNQQLARKIPAEWQNGKVDRETTLTLLRTLRDGSEDDACDKVVELLRDGAGPQAIWDGLFLGAGELVVRQSGIVALHAVTTTNALHYCYQAAGDNATRRLILLQNAAFLPMFRRSMAGRGKVRDFALDELQPEGEASVSAIFDAVNRDPARAAKATLAYFQSDKPLGPWVEEARRLVVRKGSSVHDYKFAFASFEDAERISPQWLGHYLAASTYLLQGAAEDDNPLVEQAAQALR